MMTEPTVERFREMHLPNMADTLQIMLDNPQDYTELSFLDKISLMVDSEYIRRENARLYRLLKNAGFSEPEACVENIRYDSQRNLDKARMIKLSICDFISAAQNDIFLGATGTGKTYLSCALGVAATRKFYSVKYKRLPALFAELEEARCSNTLSKLLRKYQKVDLLILDEWLISPISQQNALDLLEIMEIRYNHKSTIFCSQIEIDGWLERIMGERTVAEAILDRIVNNTFVIRLEGESMRKIIGCQR